MNASSHIRRHINLLSEETLFNNQDFLSYGSRALIDWTLSKMCKAGQIIREARGVYRKACIKQYQPSLMQIVLFKAKVFGRRIVADFLDSAHKVGLEPAGNRYITFLSDGATSSFATVSGIRIHFKNRCARKIGLNDDYIGTSIKALWHYGCPVRPIHLQQIFRLFGREEGRAFRASAPLMPGWMADALSLGERSHTTKEEDERKRRQKEIEKKYLAMKHLLTPKPDTQITKDLATREKQGLHLDDTSTTDNSTHFSPAEGSDDEERPPLGDEDEPTIF
jgi:hypothetical protein